MRRQTGLGLNAPITFFLTPSANTEIFSTIHRNIINHTEKYAQYNREIFLMMQRNILNFNEDTIVEERKNDAMMQMSSSDTKIISIDIEKILNY